MSEEAVSSVVGTVLMVGLVSACFGIIYLEVIPQVQMMADSMRSFPSVLSYTENGTMTLMMMSGLPIDSYELKIDDDAPVSGQGFFVGGDPIIYQFTHNSSHFVSLIDTTSTPRLVYFAKLNISGCPGSPPEPPQPPAPIVFDLFVGGSGPGNYSTIAEAVYHAEPGDNISVYPGTYPESVTITKSLTIIGTDRNDCIMDASFTYGFLIQHDSINISNLTITGYVNAIWSDGYSHQNFSNLKLVTEYQYGIFLDHGEDITVFNTIFAGTADAYGLVVCTDEGRINACTFQYLGFDVRCYGSRNTASHNNFYDADNVFDAGTENTWNSNFWSFTHTVFDNDPLTEPWIQP